MSRRVIHLGLVRRVFGGIVNTSTCGRTRLEADGMNLTANPKKVSCKFCLKKLKLRAEKGKVGR